MVTEKSLGVNSPNHYTQFNTPTQPASNRANRAVDVVGIVPGDAPGVLATVTIRVGGIVLRGVTVSDRGRGVYVNFPSRKIDGAWINLVEIASPQLREHVVSVILAAVRGAQ
jgi:DNA-binding cell septation regulator SpoVG